MKLAGIEYAETNTISALTSCWYALHEWLNPATAQFTPGVHGTLRYGDVGIWGIFLRCPCGVGHESHERAASRWRTKSEPLLRTDTSANRWLCHACGRGGSTTLPWVGRRRWGCWEWKPLRELPDDLQQYAEGAVHVESAMAAAREVEAALKGSNRDEEEE